MRKRTEKKNRKKEVDDDNNEQKHEARKIEVFILHSIR